MEVKTKTRFAVFAAMLTTLAMTSGCSLLTTITWMGGGDLVPADYDDLVGKRVAVICVSDTSSYGSGSESLMLSREVRSLLRKHVDEIELVRADDIADWIDREGWDEIDYREIGRGVKAQRVVAIGLAEFGIHEGASLYRGRADLTVTVYDMEDGGHEVFRKSIPEFSFPATGPYPIGDLSEVQFRSEFLKTLSNSVARHFYPYDMRDDYSRDAGLFRP